MDISKITEAIGKIPKGITQVALMIALIIGAYYVGTLKTKVDFYEKGAAASAVTAQQPAQQAQAPAQPTVTIDSIKEVFKQNVIKFGDAGKKLLLVEIADPSCPYCHVAAGKDGELNKQIDKQSGRNQFTLTTDGGTYVAPVPELKKLVDSGKAAFAYIYTPGHGNGEMGTKALYCAAEKGKFWEVHDLLMSNSGYDLLNNTVKNDKTKSGDLAEFLKSAMNPANLKNCLDSGKYDSHLQEDIKLATSLGVQGTPGFFINATAFGGAYNFKDMEPAIASALK